MRGRKPRPVQTGHKWCPGCQQELPLVAFGKNAARGDGLQPHCKSCKNASKWSKYDASKRPSGERLIRQRETNRNWKANNKDKVSAANRRYIERNKMKQAAHRTVLHAVINGTLVRQPCEICGATENIHAHHDSYEAHRQLDVRWLCHRHHMELHRRH